MEIRQLRTFLVLAQLSHFGKTGEALHISQPSVSRNIAQLEEEIGVALFERLPHEVRMTTAGRKFLPYAERTLAELERGIDAVARQPAEPKPLRIAIIQAWSVHLALVKRLQNTQRLYPHLRFELISSSTANIQNMVINGQADLGICYTPLRSSDMEAHLWYKQGLILAIPRALNDTIVDVADLNDVPWIHYHPHLHYRGIIERLWKKYHLAPTIAAECSTSNLATSMVLAGLGCSLVPHLPAASAGSVVERSDLFPSPVHNVYIVTLKRNDDPLLQQVLASISAEEAPSSLPEVGVL